MLTLEQALAELGDTPDAVAAHLQQLGITGVRQDNFCCPVARYLGRVTNIDDPAVEPGLVEGFNGNGEFRECETPDAVGAFVIRFDNGEWPELEGLADGAAS